MTSYTDDGSCKEASSSQDNKSQEHRAPSETDGLLSPLNTTEDNGQNNNNDTTDTTDYDGETASDGRRNRKHHHRRDSSALQFAMGAITEGMELFVDTATDVKDAIVETATDVKDAIVEGVVEGVEAIAEEAHDVKESLMDGLADKDDGESVIYEMGLTRNIAVLPSDIEEVGGWHHHHNEKPIEDDDAQTILTEVMDTFDCCPETIRNCCQPNQANLMDSPPQGPQRVIDLEAGETTPLVEKPATINNTSTSASIPFHAYITLLGAVVSLSSIGPSLDLQGGVDASTKIYWRMTGTYMVLLPLAIRAVMKEGLPQLTNAQWGTFFLAALSYASMCVCFVLALDLTSVANVVIFGNSQSLLLLMGKALVGEAVSMMEGIGALIAFSGAILCASDSSATTGGIASTGPVWSGWGDLLALMSATGGVLYLVLAKSLRHHVSSVFLFMFMIMFQGSFCVLAFLWVTGVDFTFDREVHHGLWGFMNLQIDRLPLEIYMVCVCNMMGAMGYVRSMAYFDNLVISVATLMEPVVASFMAYGLNVGVLPNAMGWIGNFLVMAGTVAVIYPSSQGKSTSSLGH